MANNKVTHEEINTLIRALGLSPTVSELFEGSCKDEVMQRYLLDRSYTDPYMVLSLEKIQQDTYLIDRYKPFLAYASSTIFAYDTLLKGYVSYNIELDVTDLKACLTWDGLFIPEIRRWWEYEISDEDIIHIGQLFGLKHTAEILQSIYDETGGEGFATVQALAVWEAAMIAQINAAIT